MLSLLQRFDVVDEQTAVVGFAFPAFHFGFGGVGKKIREAEMQRIPYMLVVGKKEVEEKTVSVRSRDKGDQGTIELAKLASHVQPAGTA